MGNEPMPVCAAMATENEKPSPRPSLIMVDVIKSFPRPPYSSGKDVRANLVRRLLKAANASILFPNYQFGLKWDILQFVKIAGTYQRSFVALR